MFRNMDQCRGYYTNLRFLVKFKSAGRKIPIVFDLSSRQHCNLRFDPSTIPRKIHYILGSSKNHKSCVLNQLRDENFNLETELSLAPEHMHIDMCTELIQVNHETKFTARHQDSDGHIYGKE